MAVKPLPHDTGRYRAGTFYAGSPDLHWPTGRELLSLMVLTHELLFILSRYPDSRMTGLPSVIQHSHVAAWARLTVSLFMAPSVSDRPQVFSCLLPPKLSKMRHTFQERFFLYSQYVRPDPVGTEIFSLIYKFFINCPIKSLYFLYNFPFAKKPKTYILFTDYKT